MCSTSQLLSQCLRYFYAASYNYHIDVFRRAVQEYIAYIATYRVAFQAQLVGCG